MNALPKSSLEIKFYGDLATDKVRAKDLAEVIEAFEEMIASVVVEKEPDLKKDQIVISLVEIRSGSVETLYHPNFQSLTIPALQEICNSITENDLSVLPESALSSLEKIAGFNKKYNCEASITMLNGDIRNLCKITSEIRRPKPILIRGETVLYGEITRVGGAKDPKIQLCTIDGRLIYIDATKKIAKEAGQKIYSQVGLQGIAEWDAKTNDIISFQVNKIIDYQKRSILNSFEELAALFGSNIEDLGDASEFVNSVRHGGE